MASISEYSGLTLPLESQGVHGKVRHGWSWSMKVGDLVKFVGHAKFYKGRIGTIVKTWPEVGCHSAYVYFSGAEGQGRDEAGFGQMKNGFHAMAYDELEVISESR